MNDASSVARFYGDLDIDTLGGAGFASQRTTAEDQTWNLSEYEGLELSIEKADCRKFCRPESNSLTMEQLKSTL